MCLITTNPTIKIAQEDIICYKWLRTPSSGELISPYYRYIYNIGEKQPIKKLVLEIYKPEIYKQGKEGTLVYCIEEGYHTRNVPRSLNHICIIPKGTAYIDGLENGIEGEYNRVSETLIVTGEVFSDKEITNQLKGLTIWDRIVNYFLNIFK